MATVCRFLVCALLLASVTAGGCGVSSTPIEQPTSSTVELIKSDLKMVIDNGQLGSEMMSIQNNLEKLREENSAKAEELLADLKALEQASGAAVKAKAQQMMDKL